MITISSPTDFVRAINVITANHAEVNDTVEALCFQFSIIDGTDNLYFRNHGHLEMVWSAIEDYMLGRTPEDTVIDRLVAHGQLGWFDPQAVCEYGTAFSGVKECINQLLQDSNTRQAAIRLAGDSCLMSVQFMLRHNTLTTIATFRSLDLVKGLPVDAYVLQRLTDVVINGLGRSDQLRRNLVVIAGSAHIYKSDIHTVKSALENLTG